jgi:trimeric autotransporter adhesin
MTIKALKKWILILAICVVLQKAELRAGTAFGTGSVASGTNAFAAGFTAIASGTAAVATGYQTSASGPGSTAMGIITSATGYSTTALGYDTFAAAPFSMALGYSSTASGLYSIAMGYHVTTTSSGWYGLALGYYTTASSHYATALGGDTLASGGGSTAMGVSTTASGFYSTASGYNTIADTQASFAMGRWNVGTSGSGSAGSWVSTDPLFEVGNGTSHTARADALKILKNGNTTFSGNLTINGTDNEMPNQGLLGSHSVLTRGLADSRYIQGSGVTASPSDFSAAGGNATGGYASAFGQDVAASGGNSFAAGSYTTASGYASTAIGKGAVATGLNSTALGYGTLASGQESTAMGGITTASGEYSTASGYHSTSSGWYSEAMGNNAQATQWGAVSLGDHTSAIARDSVALGAYSSASAYAAIASGYYTVASGENSTASGYETTASGNGSTASGYQSVAAGVNAVAFGTQASAGGFSSAAFGYQTNASSDYSTASGYGSTASGEGSVAMGWYDTASGNYSTAFGEGNQASGEFSAVIGGSIVHAQGFASTASGYYTTASAAYDFVVGANNTGGGNPTTWVPTDPIFEIGNAPLGSTHSDALEVLKNGNTQIWGNLTLTGSTNSIVINPAAGNITLNGAPVLVSGSNLSFTSSDHFGVGTSTPGNMLQVGAGSGMDATAVSAFYGPSTAGGWISVGSSNAGKQVQLGVDGTSGFITTLSNQPIQFRPDNSVAMSILTNGYVGIGTTTPVSPLEIIAPLGGTDTLTLDQPSSSGGNNYTNLILANSNGRIGNIAVLGAGYSLPADFGPNDLVMLAGQDYSASNLVVATNSSGAVKFATGGYSSSNERMRITSSGQVGINTTTPQATLDVNGTVMVSGSTSAVLINQQGDLTMGTFTSGTAPN